MLQLFESAIRSAALLAPELARGDGGSPSFGEIHASTGSALEIAGAAPLVLVIDDADLADEESLRFLLYLTERIRDLPIALVLTAGVRRAATGAGAAAGHRPPSRRVRCSSSR